MAQLYPPLREVRNVIVFGHLAQAVARRCSCCVVRCALVFLVYFRFRKLNIFVSGLVFILKNLKGSFAVYYEFFANCQFSHPCCLWMSKKIQGASTQ